MTATKKTTKKVTKKVTKKATKKATKRSPSKKIERTNPEDLDDYRGLIVDHEDLDIDDLDQLDAEDLRALVRAQAAQVQEAQLAVREISRRLDLDRARRARIGRAAKRAGFRSAEDWAAYCEARGQDPEILNDADLARIKRANELRSRALGNP